MAYVVVSTWHVGAGDEDAALAALERVGRAARGLEGTLAYAVNRALEDPRRILVYQEYVDAAAFDAHHAGPHLADPGLRAVIDRLDWRERVVYETADGVPAAGQGLCASPLDAASRR